MAKTQKRLNDAKSEVIEEEFLAENPKGIPDAHGLVIAKEIPKMRKITFLNERDPGKDLEFHYASGTHPLKQYKLHHGFDYDLPEEIIQHLEQCAASIYGYRRNQYGLPEIYTKAYQYHFRCKNPKVA